MSNTSWCPAFDTLEGVDGGWAQGVFRAITRRTEIERSSTNLTLREHKNKIPGDKDIITIWFTSANCALLSGSGFDRWWGRGWSSGLPRENEGKGKHECLTNRETYKSSLSDLTMIAFLGDWFAPFFGDCFPPFLPLVGCLYKVRIKKCLDTHKIERLTSYRCQKRQR